ncbi:MAG: endonuclease IV [Clostridiales bacterium]|nr:MAG: endonuclease IV [Clostridiales bacterium]
MIHFGPGGNCNWFKESGKKTSDQMPAFLNEIGLDAYEVECGRGVRMNAAVAQRLREEAEAFGTTLSIHAPYYISMSSVEPEKRAKSVDYLLESAALARKIGAKRIIFHSGSCARLGREEATALALQTLQAALDAFDQAGYGDLVLCPETMGKINQLGSLDEVMTLCALDERLLPTIDFGHLNAREQGLFYKAEDYERVLETIEDALGAWRAAHFHAHFSKIEYTTGGEKRHLTFEDRLFGPEFEPLAEVLAKRGASPVIICESAGTQSKDALEMKRIYEKVSAIK